MSTVQNSRSLMEQPNEDRSGAGQLPAERDAFDMSYDDEGEDVEQQQQSSDSSLLTAAGVSPAPGKRGRRRKHSQPPAAAPRHGAPGGMPFVSTKRGSPRKNPFEKTSGSDAAEKSPVPRKRGRPSKSVQPPAGTPRQARLNRMKKNRSRPITIAAPAHAAAVGGGNGDSDAERDPAHDSSLLHDSEPEDDGGEDGGQRQTLGLHSSSPSAAAAEKSPVPRKRGRPNKSGQPLAGTPRQARLDTTKENRSRPNAIATPAHAVALGGGNGDSDAERDPAHDSSLLHDSEPEDDGGEDDGQRQTLGLHSSSPSAAAAEKSPVSPKRGRPRGSFPSSAVAHRQVVESLSPRKRGRPTKSGESPTAAPRQDAPGGVPTPSRKGGRPRKYAVEGSTSGIGGTSQQATPNRKRGRPKKITASAHANALDDTGDHRVVESSVLQKRGRPRKSGQSPATAPRPGTPGGLPTPARKRGRPRKDLAGGSTSRNGSASQQATPNTKRGRPRKITTASAHAAAFDDDGDRRAEHGPGPGNVYRITLDVSADVFHDMSVQHVDVRSLNVGERTLPYGSKRIHLSITGQNRQSTKNLPKQ